MTLTSADQTPYFVGAYAAAPSLARWDPSAEGSFLTSVLALEGVAGLEIPFTGKLHKDDEAWFLRQLPEKANFVVTAPGEACRRRPGTSWRPRGRQGCSVGRCPRSLADRASSLEHRRRTPRPGALRCPDARPAPLPRGSLPWKRRPKQFNGPMTPQKTRWAWSLTGAGLSLNSGGQKPPANTSTTFVIAASCAALYFQDAPALTPRMAKPGPMSTSLQLLVDSTPATTTCLSLPRF